MELSLTKEDYCCLKKSFDTVLEETVEAEICLPDYLPEICRVVKTTAVPKILSSQTVGERFTVEGNCDLTVAYCSSDGGLYSFSQTARFSRYCENSAFANADDVEVSVSTGFANCRVSGPKRAELKAGLRICVNAFCRAASPIISVSGETLIEQQTLPVTAASAACRKSRVFSMSETFENTGSPAAFLVGSEASAILTEVKKINNKCMIKGETVIELSFVPASDHTVCEHVRHTLPINQILEFDGMDETFSGDVTLSVQALDVVIKNDSGGEGRMFDAAVSISACVSMWEERDFFIVSDAYALSGKASLTREPIEFREPLCTLKETLSVKQNVTLPPPGASRILDVCRTANTPEIRFSEKELTVSGTVTLNIIYCDTSGDISAVERVVDYSYSKGFETECALSLTPSVTICSCDAALSGSDCAVIRLEIQLCGTVFEVFTIDTVTDISLEESAVIEKESSLTVYFPRENESLWSIARRYRTTVTAICEENELSGETCEDRKMLFIPTV